MLESLFNKVADFGLELYFQKTPTQVFSYEYCEILLNSFFVSATRRSRDIKIPLCLPVPIRKSLIW